MPQPAVQFAADTSALPLPEAAPAVSEQPVIVTLGERDLAWAASPARDLHARLVESFAPVEPRADVVLSLRQRTLVLVGSAALLWIAIGAVGLALLA